MKKDVKKHEIVCESSNVNINNYICAADFAIGNKIGKGAFGDIYWVQKKSSKKVYVMKKVYQNPKSYNREASCCAMVNHSCIVKYHYIFFQKHKEQKYLYLIMDHYPRSLKSYLKHRKVEKQTIPEEKICLYLYQILNGLLHLNELKLTHRDLKPENILINPANDKVVICDLGSAKNVDDGTYNKAYMCSRLYRAPELLCDCELYCEKIDIWSAGVIMGEIYLMRILFPGKDANQQLEYIEQLLGKLSPKDKKKLNSGFRDVNYTVEWKYDNWQDVLKSHAKTEFSPEAIELIQGMMHYDPQLRFDVKQCLSTPYFDKINIADIPLS